MFLYVQEKVNLSVVSPRMIPAVRQVFELGQPNEELEKEVGEQVDHALSLGHLVLFQGFEVPGELKLLAFKLNVWYPATPVLKFGKKKFFLSSFPPPAKNSSMSVACTPLTWTVVWRA